MPAPPRTEISAAHGAGETRPAPPRRPFLLPLLGVAMCLTLIADLLTRGRLHLIELLVLLPPVTAFLAPPAATLWVGGAALALSVTVFVMNGHAGWAELVHMAVLGGTVVIGLWISFRRQRAGRRSGQRRARHRAALRESVSLLQATLESTTDGLLVVGVDRRITSHNRRMIEIWNCVAEIVPAGDEETIMTAMAGQVVDPQAFLQRVHDIRALPEAESFDVVGFLDGRIVERYSRPQKVGNRTVGRVWSFRDVTGQRQAQRAAALLAREWQATFDSVDQAILVLDEQGTVRHLNAAAESLMDSGSGVPAGASVRSVASREPWASVARLLVDPDAMERTITVQAADPVSQRIWLVSVNRADPAGAEPGRALAIIREITNVVRLQQSALRNEAIMTMGALVAGVAHEVRNPLFAISASLDAFEARFGNRPEHRQYLDVLRRSVSRLSGLMQQLLDYGKPQQMRFERVNLRECVSRAIESLAPDLDRAGIQALNEIPEALPDAVADSERLSLVLQNLLVNAIQHSTDGDAVRVSARFLNEEGREWLECRVTDRGPGFRDDALEHIFEPFYSGRPGGVGLGLAIVQRVVEQHGGQVEAANQPDGGAVVRIRLPAASSVTIESPT